jgi:hypothetical protein
MVVESVDVTKTLGKVSQHFWNRLQSFLLTLRNDTKNSTSRDVGECEYSENALNDEKRSRKEGILIIVSTTFQNVQIKLKSYVKI